MKLIRSRSIAVSLIGIAMLWMSQPGISAAVEYTRYPALVELVEIMTTKDGYPKAELEKVLNSATIDQKTLELMDRQYESLPWHKYRKIFINQDRIDRGVKFWNTYQLILERAEREFGVPPMIIVALIGVETHYGTRIGDKRVLDSLVTLSAEYPRRSSFFTSELRTFLNITRKENIEPGSVLGSFAGAIGIPQFMPTSYEAYSVDFNGNQQRDLVNETDDAIGSVANYLKIHGWKAEQAVYSKVSGSLSESASQLVSTRAKLNHELQELVNRGVNFDSSRGSSKVALVSLEEEAGKRYFVAYKNFYALTRYNPSVNYAMAVSELAEAIERKRNQQ